MNDKWLQRYFDLANHVAQWSKDATKVGAVIVGKDKREISVGYNGFPAGIEDTDERLMNKDLKYKFTQHAEQNCLDNTLFDTRGATLVVTMFPCSNCAKSIVSKKIACVVCPPPLDREPWCDDAEFSKVMFAEAGVSLRIIKK